MCKLVVVLLCLSVWCSQTYGGHHHDTTSSTSSSTTGSTHSSDSTDTTSSSSSDSHHHSDHHRNGESYSSHDHDTHHGHGRSDRPATNKVRRETRWTGSDEQLLVRKMRVALDAAKLRSASSSSRAASHYDVVRPAVLPRSGPKKIKTK